jgi:hypothetical protein
MPEGEEHGRIRVIRELRSNLNSGEALPAADGGGGCLRTILVEWTLRNLAVDRHKREADIGPRSALAHCHDCVTGAPDGSLGGGCGRLTNITRCLDMFVRGQATGTCLRSIWRRREFPKPIGSFDNVGSAPRQVSLNPL